MVLRPNSAEKSFAPNAHPLPRPYILEIILSSTVCIVSFQANHQEKQPTFSWYKKKRKADTMAPLQPATPARRASACATEVLGLLAQCGDFPFPNAVARNAVCQHQYKVETIDHCF